MTVDIPTPYEAAWNRADEADFHQYVIREQIPTAAAQRLIDHYIDAYTLSGGNIDWPSAEVEFNKKFAGEVVGGPEVAASPLGEVAGMSSPRLPIIYDDGRGRPGTPPHRTCPSGPLRPSLSSITAPWEARTG